MATAQWMKRCSGKWEGKSLLNLSWPPENAQIIESTSDLKFSVSEDGSFAKIEYRWLYECKWECGVLILACDKDISHATGAWVDSWHQSAAVMFLAGKCTEEALFDVNGEYEVPGHPNWGWRIEVTLESAETLKFNMFNISPEGEEDWAVRAEYHRV